MSGFFIALIAATCFLSLTAVLACALTAARVRELQDRLAHLPVSRLKSVETSLTELQDGLEAVANRVKMMRVRNAANHVADKSGAPDPYTNPDEWRKEMNRTIARGKLK
jgi:hypothetical protein